MSWISYSRGTLLLRFLPSHKNAYSHELLNRLGSLVIKVGSFDGMGSVLALINVPPFELSSYTVKL